MNKSVSDMLVVAGSTLCIYVFLAVAMRIFSRRQLGQLTALDLLIVILLGSSVETAMVHGSTLFRMGFVSAITLIVTNRLIARLMLKSKKFGRLFGSGPVLLIHNGKFIDEHLKRAGLTHEDVMQGIREREQGDIVNIRFAVLEPDGQINVVCRS